MRVLHVVPTYLPARRYGGTIHAIHGLCKNLAQLRHEVHVFTTNVDGDQNSNVPIGKTVIIDGVRVHYFDCKYSRYLYFSPSLQNALLRDVKNYEIVHLHSLFRWPTWAAARSAERSAVPYVLSPRGMLVQDMIRRKNYLAKSIWIQWIEKHTLEKAAGIHATSELEAQEISKFRFRLALLFVIPNGYDPEHELHNEPKDLPIAMEGLSQRKPLLLFLGRINWKKGLDRLIPALTGVPNAHLAIVGNDEENYLPFLKQLAKTQGVWDRVHFMEPIYGASKIKLMKAATIFVLPSYSENFGNAALEAMSVGCPVLLTPEVGLAETVAASGAGRIVSGDSQRLGEALREMLSNPESLNRMGERGRQTAASFIWDSLARQMEAKYLSILNR